MNLLTLTILQAIIDWGEIGATAVSAVGVLIAVRFLTWALPILRQRYPWILPILATLGPVGLTKLAEILLGVFGYPVDFGPLIDLLAGAGAFAVVIHQVHKQRGKGEKRSRAKRGGPGFRHMAPIFIIAIMLSSTSFGQGYDKSRGRPEAEKSDAKIQIQVERIALGIGAFFNQPNLSTDALFASVQLHGVGLPFIREGTSTGIVVEGHVTKIFTETVGDAVLQSFETMDWRLWSMTRVPVSAIPIRALQSGTPSRMFVGTDILLTEGGIFDWTDEFDARFVVGGDLGVLGPGNLVVEVYMFQQNIPVAVMGIYGF